MHDLLLAFRALAKTPRFTLLAVLVLTVGIAGNTVVFSLVNGLFIRPLPFPEPDRLVDLDETAPKWGLTYTGISYDDFEAWRAHNKTFESMATWRGGAATLSNGERTELLPGQFVTHDLAEVLGVRPVLGRMFTADEELKSTASVALVAGIMALTGLYGLVSYVVGQRTREFGIRLALIAQPRDPTILVLLACLAPTRRAARLNPNEILRSE